MELQEFIAREKMQNQMHDSGKREESSTGAVRDTAEGKARPDLISPYAQMRKGEWLRLGAKKYTERNWEKGMKIGRCIASLERHLQEYKMGLQNEDHLAAIAVNAEFIMHYEKMIEMGLLPAELDDMPRYEQQVEHPEPLMAEKEPTIEYASPCGWQIRLVNGKFLMVYPDECRSSRINHHQVISSPYYYPSKGIAEEYLADYLRSEL